MTEWYVYSEGHGGKWTPKEAVLGRAEAVRRLTANFKVTPDERRRILNFARNGVCDLGDGPFVVGYDDPNGKMVMDRRLTRVVGPGTEV